jgi:hypothetical protein
MYMISKNITEKKRMTFIFFGFYAASAVLLILIFTVFWNRNSADGISRAGKNHLSGDDQLLQAEDLLQERLNNVQYADKKFASLLADSGIKANFDTIFNKIQEKESAFRHAVDSISGMEVSVRNLGKFNQIISSYKSALENRNAIDDIQKGITLGSKQFHKDQQALIQLRDNLLKKDSSIAGLNEQLKTGADQKDRYAVSFPSTDYKLLKNENKYLKSELKLMEMKLTNQRNSKNIVSDEDKTFVNAQLKTSSKTSASTKN